MLTGVIRTIILFCVTAIVLRLMGKRQLAQLQPYEVVITLMMSDLATQPMNDVEIPLASGIVAILTLLLLHSLLSVLSFVSMRMRRLICGRPSVLVRDGKICEQELSRLCFDLSDLMEGMRTQGIIGLHEAGCVILETNGALSVFPKSSERAATRGEMGLPDVYDGIPLTLILDGQVQRRALSLCGRDGRWLTDRLAQEGIDSAKDVLVAALDTQGRLLIQEKGGRQHFTQAMRKDEVMW